MTLKKFAAAGALALSAVGVLGAVSPAYANSGSHPGGPGFPGGPAIGGFGGPDVISPTSVDGNGLLNNLLSVNICGTNILPIELVPVLSPTTAACEESQNDDVIKVVD